jgi:hypothetical protein
MIESRELLLTAGERICRMGTLTHRDDLQRLAWVIAGVARAVSEMFRIWPTPHPLPEGHKATILDLAKSRPRKRKPAMTKTL